MRRILRIPYRSHRWLLAQLGQQKHNRNSYSCKIVAYALNHDNPIVRQFTNIALRCSRSPMGANIVPLRHLYDVSIDKKLVVMSTLFVICTSYIMIMSNMQQTV